jgi:hypothetical protein
VIVGQSGTYDTVTWTYVDTNYRYWTSLFLDSNMNDTNNYIPKGPLLSTDTLIFRGTQNALTTANLHVAAIKLENFSATWSDGIDYGTPRVVTVDNYFSVTRPKFGSTTSIKIDSILSIGGVFYTDSGVVFSGKGDIIFNGTGTQYVVLNNNHIGPIVNSKPSGVLAFADSGRVQKYTATVDSLALAFTGAKGLRIDTTDTGSLNGITGKLNRYSASSGTARLYLPAVYTHSYSSWTGISVFPVDQVANNGTVTNGGGNIGFLFPATSGRRGGSRGLRLNGGLDLGL